MSGAGRSEAFTCQRAVAHQGDHGCDLAGQLDLEGRDLPASAALRVGGRFQRMQRDRIDHLLGDSRRFRAEDLVVKSVAQPGPVSPIARCSAPVTQLTKHLGSHRRWMKDQWQVREDRNRTPQRLAIWRRCSGRLTCLSADDPGSVGRDQVCQRCEKAKRING